MSSLSLHNNSSISKAAASSSISTSTKSLSFDDISKYFSLPLSDAANHLGVCVSVLKKICRDNGLDRWPYRKFLSGKSIEDIKKYAAREKSKELAELSKIARKRYVWWSFDSQLPVLDNYILNHREIIGNFLDEKGLDNPVFNLQ